MMKCLLKFNQANEIIQLLIHSCSWKLWNKQLQININLAEVCNYFCTKLRIICELTPVTLHHSLHTSTLSSSVLYPGCLQTNTILEESVWIKVSKNHGYSARKTLEISCHTCKVLVDGEKFISCRGRIVPGAEHGVSAL